MGLWIGLFRGINVGGNHKLPMKALSAAMEAAGLTQVKTYIASGNVVFRSDKTGAELETLIGDMVETGFGFRPRVLVMSLEHLEKVARENPFRDHEHLGKAQHIFFLMGPVYFVDPDLLNSLKADSEAWHLTDHALYLYAPEGIGRSKLAEKMGRGIKAEMTARNLNTVEALIDLAKA